MRVWTYADIKSQVEKNLDLQDELFIRPDELMQYVNEGIEEAEAEIHTLGAEDRYFLTKKTIPVVAGQDAYPLPSDIYANKIRTVLWSRNGINYMPLKRIRDPNVLGLNFNGDSPEGYIIMNPSASAGVQLTLVPTPRAALPSLMIIYLRSANRMTADDSVCDIPEFVRFVIQYAKCLCLEKEGNPRLPIAVAKLDRLRQLMVATLSDMVPDAGDLIPGDFSFYDFFDIRNYY
jgi:hypothetical protein